MRPRQPAGFRVKTTSEARSGRSCSVLLAYHGQVCLTASLTSCSAVINEERRRNSDFFFLEGTGPPDKDLAPLAHDDSHFDDAISVQHAMFVALSGIYLQPGTSHLASSAGEKIEMQLRPCSWWRRS